jgi:hypothetical protein
MEDDEDLDYTTARDNYIAETRRDLSANLREYELWSDGDPLPLHIVSKETLYDFIKDEEERRKEHETGKTLSGDTRKGGKRRNKYIDEPQLVYDLLRTAYERRYTKT